MPRDRTRYIVRRLAKDKDLVLSVPRVGGKRPERVLGHLPRFLKASRKTGSPRLTLPKITTTPPAAATRQRMPMTRMVVMREISLWASSSPDARSYKKVNDRTLEMTAK